MKKAVSILLVSLILILLVVGALIFSFRDTTAEVNNTTLDSHIIQNISFLQPSYEGFLIIASEISIFNSGMLDIEELNVDILAEFRPDLNSENKLIIGRGENLLGIISADSTVDFTIEVNATQNIPALAISDGIIILTIDVSLKLQYMPYDIEIQETAKENWQAPFSGP